MMTYPRLLSAGLLALGLLAGAAAVADITLVFDGRSGEDTFTQAQYITRDRVRMDVEGGGDNSVMLFDPKTKTLTVLDAEQKLYMEITEQTAKQMRSSMQAMHEEMMANMEEEMKNLSEQERESVKQMMAEAGGSTKANKPPLRIEKTGQKQTVKEFRCEVVNAYRGDHKVQELCVTPPAELGLTQDEFQAVRALLTAFQQMAPDEDSAVLAVENIPVRVKDFEDDQETVVELKKVAKDTLNADLFAIPAGYSKEDPLAGE